MSAHIRSILILTYLACSCFAWSSEPKEDAERIEDLTVALKAINPIEFDLKDSDGLLKKMQLDLSGRPADMLNLYTKVTFAGSGSWSLVYSAVLAQDRPRSGLKKGERIALKTSRYSEVHTKSSKYESLIRLSSLKTNQGTKKPLTDYFPAFYGVYFTGNISSSIAATCPDCNKPGSGCYSIEEMEWVDTTFLDEYTKKHMISDSVIFEFLYGEWVGRYALGIMVEDNESRNYGLKCIDNARCYHLGEQLYFFDTQKMPMRIDLSQFSQIKTPPTKRFERTLLHPDEAETQQGKNVLAEIGEIDVFTAFEKHFSPYKKDPNWVENYSDKEVKHFYLDQRWIDYEKSLVTKSK